MTLASLMARIALIALPTAVVACRSATPASEHMPEPQPQVSAHQANPAVLPDSGMPEAQPVLAGVAQGAEAVRRCLDVELERARAGKWPPILLPSEAVGLRSEGGVLSLEEWQQTALQFGFGLDDQDGQACFLNAYEARDDGTVMDHSTHLLWRQRATTPVTLAEATAQVGKLSDEKVGGSQAWRVPTLPELASLMDWQGGNERLCRIDQIVFRAPGGEYWTSDVNEDSIPWFIDAQVAGTGVAGPSYAHPKRLLAVSSESAERE